MRWCRYFLVGACLLAGALPAPAGLFSKKKPVEPAQRVPELLQIVKQDKDDRKRSAAAEELRQYDASQFPMIVPTLAEVLQTDPRAGVRIDAAQTLGKLRPLSQAAAQALEKATHDGNMRVRLQARTSLMFYHMAGYSAKKVDAVGPPAKTRTDEPPLLGKTPPPTPRPQPAPPGIPAETAPPPLAAPPAPAPTSLYRPLPSGPVPTQAAPQLQPVAENEGPVLTPQVR